MTKHNFPVMEHFWLTNAHVPLCLESKTVPQDRDGLVLLDLEIAHGQIRQIIPSRPGNFPRSIVSEDVPVIDLHQGMVWPCFVDVHTHLDKGHIWERSPNRDATFDTALSTVLRDSTEYWREEDVYQRMEFGLKCSYVHGTQAIRTHIDALGKQAKISFQVFQDLQKQWSDRLILQAVSLVSLDYYLTAAGVKLADLVTTVNGGILGGVAYMNPNIDNELETFFQLATARNLDIDLHVDETDDPNSIILQLVAKTAIKYRNEYNFTGKITCGHCCSLAVQSPEVAKETINLVKQADIHIVSLPMCNLYLQDRHAGKTPHWRGITLIHELKQAGVPVCIASDNCRDPFYGFGDHDMLEVLSMAVKIGHLDTPHYGDWPTSFTKIPASIMGLTDQAEIKVNTPANLILFRGRTFSELLSRPQSDRIVLRHGHPIDMVLPDYRELDNIIHPYHIHH